MFRKGVQAFPALEAGCFRDAEDLLDLCGEFGFHACRQIKYGFWIVRAIENGRGDGGVQDAKIIPSSFMVLEDGFASEPFVDCGEFRCGKVEGDVADVVFGPVGVAAAEFDIKGGCVADQIQEESFYGEARS